MKATRTPIRKLEHGQYVCDRCGRVMTNHTHKVNTCLDCRTIEADLAHPERVEQLTRQLDGRTHCKHGHQLDTYGFLDTRGWVQCRECKRVADRKRRRAAA